MKGKFKDIFIDPLFYLIVLDYIFTLIIVYYGFGYEINPVVLTIGFTPAFICSLLIYLFLCPKKSEFTDYGEINILGFNNLVRFLLLSYYLVLNFRHISILFFK